MEHVTPDVMHWFGQRSDETFRQALAFVPWILRQAFFDPCKMVDRRGLGAVVCSVASGLTELIGQLGTTGKGAEQVFEHLDAFFTPLVSLVDSYRGDVLRLSGDSLTVHFPSVECPREWARNQVPAHGSHHMPEIGPAATAALRSLAFCVEASKKMNGLDSGDDGARFHLRMGVGCGELSFMGVGGETPPGSGVEHFKCVFAGPPLEQVAIAAWLAQTGEICLSPDVWHHVQDCVVEDERRPLDEPGFHLLMRIDEKKYTYPTIKFAASQESRPEYKFAFTHLELCRMYIPPPVFQHLEDGILNHMNEARRVTLAFFRVNGVDCGTDKGMPLVQAFVPSVQRVCYRHEGSLVTLRCDCTGMLFMLAFGLPPLVHTDDPTRAVLCALDLLPEAQAVGLEGKLGVATGRVLCGVCGSSARKEYTILGEPLDLAARLVRFAPAGCIFVDHATRSGTTEEIEARPQEPQIVGEKGAPLEAYVPERRRLPLQSGVGADLKLHFPWYYRPVRGVQGSDLDSVHRTFKKNARLLSGLRRWLPMEIVVRIFGDRFLNMYDGNAALPPFRLLPVSLEPRRGTPFAKGGVMCVHGPTGLGGFELAEHLVKCAVYEVGFLPVVASMGPRPADSLGLGIELVRSSLGLLRYIDPTTPENALEAIAVHLPQSEAGLGGWLQDALGGSPVPGGMDDEDIDVLLLDLVRLGTQLLSLIRKHTQIIVLLHLDVGTSLFAEAAESNRRFWEAVSIVSQMTAPFPESTGCAVVLLTLTSGSGNSEHPAVQAAQRDGWFIQLAALSRRACREYLAAYLEVPEELLPVAFCDTVFKVCAYSLSNLRELVDVLVRERLLSVEVDLGTPVAVHHHHNLEAINIAVLADTALVGEAKSYLGSLKPLEVAVLKMSAAFRNPFSMADLLAAMDVPSRYGVSGFDCLRLFMAVQTLVKNGTIKVLRGDADLDVSEALAAPEMGHLRASKDSKNICPDPSYDISNFLTRKIVASMVLDMHRRLYKKRALMARRLRCALPARMRQLEETQERTHIPWFYENVLADARS